MPNRVAFVVDGFNLYHSLRRASAGSNPVPARWLDIRSLCEDHLYVIGRGATLSSIHYFSAIARHLEARNPGVVARHDNYVDAIRGSGIVAELARFLPKDIFCPNCRTKFVKHEEKQTDVALGVKVLELALSGEIETIVIVSGDSDLIPAIRTTRRLFPSVEIWMGFPAGNGGKQLRKATHGAFTFSAAQYASHQLPNPVVLGSGRTIHKPNKW